MTCGLLKNQKVYKIILFGFNFLMKLNQKAHKLRKATNITCQPTFQHFVLKTL
jgi:hypothetical protein